MNRDKTVLVSVCKSLVSHGERQDEETVSGRLRLDMLTALCTMNPKEALNVRQLCVGFIHSFLNSLSHSLSTGRSPRYFKAAYIFSFQCFLWSEVLFYLKNKQK